MSTNGRGQPLFSGAPNGFWCIEGFRLEADLRREGRRPTLSISCHVTPCVDMNSLACQVLGFNYHSERRPHFFHPPEPPER